MNLFRTKKSRRGIVIAVTFALTAAMTAMLWADSQETTATDKTDSTQAEIALVKVDPKYVCMPNNRLFKKEQLSTEIEGKTYYGCCKMCINALNSDPKQRFAIDPVSGKEIDKAKSVIGAAPDNSIYYFETEENLNSFRLAAVEEN